MQIQNILVVCVGNICRSPMAQYLLRQQYPHLNIDSAGVAGLVGQTADPKAQFCLKKLNLDLSQHVAKKLDSHMLKNADLILVMSQGQQHYLEKNWPFAKGKTFRLGHWQSCDIADPYHLDQSTFDQTCQLIQHCIQDWKSYI